MKIKKLSLKGKLILIDIKEKDEAVKATKKLEAQILIIINNYMEELEMAKKLI